MSSINPKKLKVLELKRELEKRDITVLKSMKKADLVALLVSAIESEMGQEKDFSSSEAMDDSVTSGTEGVQDSATSENECVQEAEESIGVEQTDKVPVKSGNGDAAPVEDKDLAMDAENEQPQTLQLESMVTESTENNEACQERDQAVKTEEKNEEIASIKDSESDSLEIPPDKTTSENAVDVDEKQDAVPVKAEEKSSEFDQSAAEKTDDNKIADIANADSHQTVETSNDHKKSEEKTNHQDSGRKRRHDDKTDRQNVWEDRYAPPEEEPEEEFDDSLVVLDLYNSDLNFKISKDRLSGQPLTMEGFAYLWAGARATYGVKEGKICFECKILEEDAVKHLASDEPHPHVVRVGWSTDYSSMQLGEAPLSYGYGGTGKFSAECKFSDYGETFREGDVIGCYVDFSSESGVQFIYTKNGQSLGVATTEEKNKLKDQPLFPHVLCKNTSIELNFGQRETPYFPDPAELQDYVYISSVQASERVRAVKGPQSKKECEVLMMCGLPGAGKSYFCRQKMTEEPDKKYNVLGTNAIMEKMRIMGVARKKNYAGRWELLIDNATQCLNRLLQVACRKRRNYILDQTNVYASAQRRKMRPFEGFQRKAIVIVPTEEEYKMRFEKRTDDEGKEVPEMAILGMKANFTLPEKGNLFDEVIFTELAREEAEKLIEKYREEGRKHGPPPEKRFRGGGENRNRNRDGGWRRGRGFRGPPQFVNDAPWGRFGGGPMGYGRGGSFGPGGFGRGGGFGGRQPGYGARGRDFGRGGKRDNYSRKPEHGGGRNKGGWTDHGGRGGRGGYGGYNRQNQGRGGFRNTGGSNFQARQNLPNQNNRMSQSSQSVAPQSAQSYTYGHHPHYNTQNTSGFNAGGYNQQQQQPQQQPTPQQGMGTMAQHGQTQQQGYQQTYGQQDYSQQWAQYYQQQAQAQQYQNYYANYQQQYYQQSAQQAPRQ